jgi:cysteine desulfurase
MMHYLDHAATTPVPRAVAEEMVKILTEDFGNPSTQYDLGRAAKKRLDADRALIAKALGCDAKRLFFTSCGTEGDNWAIRAALWQNRRVGKHIVTTSVEHSAILQMLKELERQGYSVTYVKPDKQGNISAESVLSAVQEDTALVSIMLVNNETGCRFPVEEIAKGLKGKATLLHTDAVQGFLKVPFTMASLGCDFVAVSGHKIGAPKGIGALYISPKLHPIQPMIRGGGQERNMRSGTEGTAQIAAFAAACKLGHEQLQSHIDYLTDLKAYTLAKLRETVPGLVVVSEGDAPHICAISMPGRPSQVVVRYLSDKGICLSSGSACHKGKASHVYAAMNLSKPTRDGMLRVSFGPSNTKEEIDALAEALLSATKDLVAAVK